MAVTYKTNKAWPGVTFPVLHKVIYAHTVDGVPAKYQKSYLDCLVDSWLRENCKHPYYHSPGYLREKFIQFECDEEAFMFSLRWGSAN
jgi:hypothetical protein